MNNVLQFPDRKDLHIEPMLKALCVSHPDRIPPKIVNEIKQKICTVALLAQIEAEAKRDQEIASTLRKDARRKQYKTNGVLGAEIMAAVCQYFNITKAQLFSRGRGKSVDHAKFVSYYLCRELTTASFPMIAKWHGGKDHTSILHGVKDIESRLPFNPQFKDEVGDLFEILTGDRIPVGVLGVGG